MIIADSDTLLAGSSLLLRQLPFNKKERGRRGQAQLKSGEFGSPLGPEQAARLQQKQSRSMAPTLGTWKGPERFWLCLIKGGQSLAAALFLGRTQLLESSLLQFLLQVAFLEKEIYPGRVSRDNFLKASKKSGKLNIWGYLATKKWNIVSTEIKLLGFWRMPESFGRKIPMKKQPLLVTKIISSSPGEINSLTFPSQAGILHAPSFSNSNFFFLAKKGSRAEAPQ